MSRTFFVSGQAQHALHFGFSPVAGAATVGVSFDFDSELPILNLEKNKARIKTIDLIRTILELHKKI